MNQKQQSLFGEEEFPPEPTPWEAAEAGDVIAAEVVVNRPLMTSFHYLIPKSLRGKIKPGQRLRVPFGRGDRATVAYCVGLGVPETSRRLKSVDSIIDARPLVSEATLQLTRWIGERYLCGWGQVLDMVIPAGVKKRAGTRLVTVYRPAPEAREAPEFLDVTTKQLAVLESLIDAAKPIPLEQVKEAAGCGESPLKTLIKKGLVLTDKVREDNFSVDWGRTANEADITLNKAQQTALDRILDGVRARQHNTFLLHGVTGSGKTEVYIQAIREAVSYGQQAIVLVPEISLTPQTIRRFRSRFDSVAMLHSHLGDAERHWHWQQIAQGKVQVVVGARSAIFAPTPHLGLIVIDEEHETTFKQETTPRYHAREVARERARMESVPLILGSATPTMESWYRVEQKKDILLSLPERVESRPMPPVSVVDTRTDPHIVAGAVLGRAMRQAIQVALSDKGQVILFLNLRGYSPTVWCRSCGEGVRCPNCAITLTLHKDRRVVLCHFCDYEAEPPQRCPQCGNPGIRYFGAGTQKLEEEVRATFRGARCMRMDSDSMRSRGSYEETLDAFRDGKVDILLGTQMIAKGLDFPNVTLVGVVDADTVLHQPDPRASERTFQLIAQVAGRTGRSSRGGRVLVQTATPSDPAIMLAASHDYISFAKRELKHREEAEASPYRNVVRVILRGEEEPAVREEAEKLVARTNEIVAEKFSEIRVLGPAPAPIAVLKKFYRYHFLMSASTGELIRELWKEVVDGLPAMQGVEFAVDVDPLNYR